MNIKTNLSLIILGVLSLLLLLSISANVRFIYSSRASEASQQTFSVDNSYLFLSPLQAVADGTERVRLTVFVLNAEGKGVNAKKVTVIAPAELVQEQIQAQTDIYGKAVFDLYTTKAGEYFIEAQVDGVKVGEAVSVRFN